MQRLKVINREKEKLDNIKKKLVNTIKENIKQRRVLQDNFRLKISTLNPYSILRRGYAFVENEHGEVLTDINKLRIEEELFITLRNGRVRVKITEIIRKER